MKIKSIPCYIRGYINYKKLDQPPIVIGGCERSGTTLLLSILSSKKNIYSIEQETWALCHSYYAGFDSKNPIKIRRLIKRLGTNTIPKCCSRWCEKSPANVFYFKEIIDYFEGSVKIIQMVRDGRDVVTSIHPSNNSKHWVSIKRWTSSVEAGLKYRNVPQVITIRYEDLILDYGLTIRRICEHIEEKIDNRIMNWYEFAKIKKNKNIVGHKIRPVFTSSIKKYENYKKNNGNVIYEFMNNKRAVELLKLYEYEL